MVTAKCSKLGLCVMRQLWQPSEINVPRDFEEVNE